MRTIILSAAKAAFCVALLMPALKAADAQTYPSRTIRQIKAVA